MKISTYVGILRIRDSVIGGKTCAYIEIELADGHTAHIRENWAYIGKAPNSETEIYRQDGKFYSEIWDRTQETIISYTHPTLLGAIHYCKNHPI